MRGGRLILVIRGQESQNCSSEVIRLQFTKIIWFSWWPGMRMDHCLPGGHSRAVFFQAKEKGNNHAWVHSDQMVLKTVRREAEPVAWWPKTLKWEFENNSGQPRDLIEKSQSDSLKQEHAYSFSRVVKRWEMLDDWCWWMRTNETTTGPCNSDSGYWRIMEPDLV